MNFKILIFVALVFGTMGCMGGSGYGEAEIRTDSLGLKYQGAPSQAKLAVKLRQEIKRELGPKYIKALSKVETRSQFVKYVRKVAKVCKRCKIAQMLVKAGLSNKKLAAKRHDIGQAILDASVDSTSPSSSCNSGPSNGNSYSSEEDDEPGECPTDTGGTTGDDEPGECPTDPTDGEGGTSGDEDEPGECPTDGNDAGTTGDEPEEPCPTGEFECLSWWGEHIGSPCDDNGGLPKTSFPDNSGTTSTTIGSGSSSTGPYDPTPQQ